MPANFQEFLEDVFFLYFPLSLIKLMTVEYAGYLKHYSPKPGDIVIDGGAWKGHFSIILARLVGEQGRVIAIEPQARMSRRLENRLKRLKLQNVVVLNRGLYSDDTEKEFGEKTASSFSVMNDKSDINANRSIIRLSKLDTIADEQNLDSIAFVKMDIEGAEIEALAGASEVLNNNNLQLAIASYHFLNGEQTWMGVENSLRDYGYETTTGYPAHLTTYGWRHSTS